MNENKIKSSFKLNLNDAASLDANVKMFYNFYASMVPNKHIILDR